MSDTMTVWEKIAAPVPSEAVQWRQQGKPKARDGKYFAPFVAYIDAQLVRDRLDGVVPGEWDLTLDLLPPGADEDGVPEVAFKARLKVLGVHREDVGTGKDYKQASTDAFKRAAVRFGIGHDLYTDYEIVWVQVDSDSKYAKPVEDPAAVWARKQSGAKAGAVPGHGSGGSREPAAPAPSPAGPPTSRTDEALAKVPKPTGSREDGYATNDMPDGDVSCPKCGGRMWDNRLSKRNPKAPDYKCRNRACDGVIWPMNNAPNGVTRLETVKRELDLEPVPDDGFPPPLADGPDGLPF